MNLQIFCKKNFYIMSVALPLLAVSCTGSFKHIKDSVDKESILVLELDGIIASEKDFVENLNKYIKDKNIKGVLIRVNSPGGGMAATQEIYHDIVRLKKQYKKPVVISIGSVAASGGFYVSMAGDKILANEGSLLGSIGVIMLLSNYEKLFEWARIENDVIKTGEFKDAPSPFRSMTNRERDYFQDLLNRSLEQFKAVIVKERKLSAELVEEYADARVFLGDLAVVQGFIDQIGTYYEALDLAGELTGLGKDPETFTPPKKIDHWSDFVLSAILKNLFPVKYLESKIHPFLMNIERPGRPLYLMPEFVGL